MKPPNGPPYRPRLRDRVQSNRSAQWVGREDQIVGFRGWHERGFTPHRDEPGLVQFVTFRLADSLPAEHGHQWEHLQGIEDPTERRAQLEVYLDHGHGDCWLRHPEIAIITEKALKHFHGERYRLIAWAVMPNHVHVLFETTTTPMSKLVESWKRFSATRANQLLGKSGAFWQEDYWDTFMRDPDHESETLYYIENNPARAGLSNWPWRSSMKIPMSPPTG